MIVSMNARAGSFPDELAKRCLLIYSSESLPSDDESGRIAMSNRQNAIEPTTRLYRGYAHDPSNGSPRAPGVSTRSCFRRGSSRSSAVRATTRSGRGPLEAYAATRYDSLREQMRSRLDANRCHSSRPPPDTEGWYAHGGKVWLRVGTSTFGQRGPLAHHLHGQSVTKLVSPTRWRVDSGTVDRMANHRADAAGSSKSANGRPDAKENTPAAARWPAMAQVIGNRLADLVG